MATDDQNTDDASTASTGSTTPAKKTAAKKATAIKNTAATPKAGDTNDAGQTYVTIQRDGEDDQLVLKPSADHSTLVYGYGWTEVEEDQA